MTITLSPQSTALITVVTTRQPIAGLSLEAAAHRVGIHPEMLRHYCRLELFSVTRAPGETDPTFDDTALFELRRFEHYRRHHGVSRRTLRILCGLARELDHLREEVRFLRRS